MKKLHPINEEQVSPGSRDPWIHLAAAISKRAIIDLGDPDPVTSVDALDWLWRDGRIYLECLGFSIGDDDIFRKAVLFNG